MQISQKLTTYASNEKERYDKRAAIRLRHPREPWHM
jgi:hypothetical protein